MKSQTINLRHTLYDDLLQSIDSLYLRVCNLADMRSRLLFQHVAEGVNFDLKLDNVMMSSFMMFRYPSIDESSIPPKIRFFFERLNLLGHTYSKLSSHMCAVKSLFVSMITHYHRQLSIWDMTDDDGALRTIIIISDNIT